MSFMSINPSNGIISISASSLPSNFAYRVTVKASGMPNGIILSQDFTLYDLSLYFSNLIDSNMLSGNIMSNKTTSYNNQQNKLWVNKTTLNGAPLPSFVKYNSSDKTITFSPTNISHFGLHTVQLTVSDAIGYSYEYAFLLNVRNRAPYFISNITNTNYSTTFKNITTFALPLIVSPDLGSPTVRVISSQDFVSFVGLGTDISMKVNA